MPDTLTFAIMFAFCFGLISIILPCALYVVTPYLAYIAGIKIQELRHTNDQKLRYSLSQTIFSFLSGFTTVCVLMGITIDHLRWTSVDYPYLYLLSLLASVVLFIIGLHFTGVRIPFLCCGFEGPDMDCANNPIVAYITGVAITLTCGKCIVLGTAAGF